MKKKIIILGVMVVSILLISVSYKYFANKNKVEKIMSKTEEKKIENPFEILGKNSLALTLDGETTSLSYSELMTSKLINKITCENGTKAEWNQADNSITLTDIKMPDYCTIDFKEGYKATVDIPNGTVTTTNPVEVGYEGTAVFTIKANDGYTTEGATVSGTGCSLNGSTLTVNNITSNRTCNVNIITKNVYIVKLSVQVYSLGSSGQKCGFSNENNQSQTFYVDMNSGTLTFKVVCNVSGYTWGMRFEPSVGGGRHWFENENYKEHYFEINVDKDIESVLTLGPNI